MWLESLQILVSLETVIRPTFAPVECANQISVSNCSISMYLYTNKIKTFASNSVSTLLYRLTITRTFRHESSADPLWILDSIDLEPLPAPWHRLAQERAHRRHLRAAIGNEPCSSTQTRPKQKRSSSRHQRRRLVRLFKPPCDLP